MVITGTGQKGQGGRVGHVGHDGRCAPAAVAVYIGRGFATGG
jgi:hypothetical protein